MKTQLEQAVVTALYYYPIKSCRGIEISEAIVRATGIIHDRELMLVEAETAEFLTQRELPKMALIQPYIVDNQLQLEAPGMPALQIPLLKEGKILSTIIWHDTCQAVDQGDEVAAWFKRYLDVDCRLVKMAANFVRTLDPQYAFDPTSQVGFADAYPMLLISEESLADLNQRLPEALPMNRFRPNVVISGSKLAFGEDYLVRGKLGNITFRAVKPCGRCKITTTNQITTEVGKEPLRTLATFRRGRGGNVYFGQNLIHENEGLLQVGDKLEVLEWREHVNWQ